MAGGNENRIVPVSFTTAFCVFWAISYALVVSDAASIKHYDVLVYGANAAGVSLSTENGDSIYATSL
jgi:hypothetical protein